MTDTHSKMALDYGTYITIAAAEFVELDMMGSTLLYMPELQTEVFNNRGHCT